jgi:hypothetical protein
MSAPLNPSIVKGSGRKELPAYLSNGVIGLRVRDNPLTAGMALLCGYAGLHPVKKVEAAATTPYPLAANLAVNDVWLSDIPHQVTVIDQAYDFSHGELTSRLRFAACGVTVDIEVLTFCCRHQPTLAVQEVTLRVDTACRLEVQALVDTRAVRGQMTSCRRDTPGGGEGDFDGSLEWRSDGALAACGVALKTELLGGQAETRDRAGGGDLSPLMIQYGLKARVGAVYRLRQVASLVPDVMHAHPQRQAERMAAFAAHQGFAQLRKASRAEWAELWKGRILLHGAEREWQQRADAAFFYLNTSVHVGSPASTSMFGLATWHDYHYYYGHVMWDIETFTVPSLIFTQPEAAQALLGFRLRTMAGARSNAQVMGRRGLQFPWEASPLAGQEAAPSPGTAAWHEDHVSPDVALAFARYAQISGDRNFLCDQAWPVLQGVSDWIVSRAHKGRRGYEIRRSMGIAETEKEYANDAFTMLAARAVLQEALRAAVMLQRSPGPEWKKVAEHMVLPMRDGMLLPHEGYRANEDKAATPGPLMALFPLESALAPRIRKKTLDYFLERAEDYIGSPMLSPLYGVWAARAGRRALSLKLLEEGYGRFVCGRFMQTLEYRPDKFPAQPMAGPFSANMGGLLMSLLLGLPRLKPGYGKPETWAEAEVVLPEGWKSIEVERLWLRGREASLEAAQGKKARLAFL